MDALTVFSGRNSRTEQRGDGSSEQKAASADSAAARRTLTFKEAFWLATMGGADALGLQVRLLLAYELLYACRGAWPPVL